MVAVNLLPDHTQLPESDGAIVENFQEHPQSILLTTSIWAYLESLHPDKNFTIGQDSGIYWKLTEEPLKGCVAPDWFYVRGVPPMLDGTFRRSYVMWQEQVIPLIAIEFVSGPGKEERDNSPPTQNKKGGKFWVYEQGIKIPYYAIYEVSKAAVEVYYLENDRYQLMSPTDRGHFVIPEMEVELGIWRGNYHNAVLPWLRWWDRDGNLLLTGEEQVLLQQQRLELECRRADAEQQEALLQRERADAESQRADEEHRKNLLQQQRAEKLAAKLRSVGIDPDELL